MSDLFVSYARSERMQQFAERTGLLAYWQAFGWPDRCRPVTGDPARFTRD